MTDGSLLSEARCVPVSSGSTKMSFLGNSIDCIIMSALLIGEICLAPNTQACTSHILGPFPRLAALITGAPSLRR